MPSPSPTPSPSPSKPGSPIAEDAVKSQNLADAPYINVSQEREKEQSVVQSLKSSLSDPSTKPIAPLTKVKATCSAIAGVTSPSPSHAPHLGESEETVKQKFKEKKTIAGQ